MKEIEHKETEELINSLTNNQKKLILYNDNVNSFENVISCLMSYCKYSMEQGEQIALLVHMKGSCEIKKGNYDDLLVIYTDLMINGLNVKIE